MKEVTFRYYIGDNPKKLGYVLIVDGDKFSRYDYKTIDYLRRFVNAPGYTIL